MPIYAKNGALLADGAALRGCCCDECALVQLRLYVSLVTGDLSHASGGSGSHGSSCYVFAPVCSCAATRSGATWSAFTAASAMTFDNCVSENGCGYVSADAQNQGDNMRLRIPYKKGTTRTEVGRFVFASSRTVLPGYTVSITWTLAIDYYSQSGGQPTARTKKPDISVVFSTGQTVNATGSNVSRAVMTSSASGGQSLQNFTANVFFT